MMTIKFATVVTVFSSVITAAVVLIGWALTTYAPLWLQIVSIPVVAWLVVILCIALVDRGAFDRWSS